MSTGLCILKLFSNLHETTEAEEEDTMKQIEEEVTVTSQKHFRPILKNVYVWQN